MKIKVNLAAFLFLTSILAGCVKEEDLTEENCRLIENVAITGAKEMYYVGDPIELGINEQPNIALYKWTHNNSNELSGTTELYIGYCEKSDEGWYYLNVSYEDCATVKVDSVYITIQQPPVDVPCTMESNKIYFSNLSDIDPAKVTWSKDQVYQKKKLAASSQSGSPDFNVYFNVYWNDKEPEDGEYGVGNAGSLGSFDPYTLYITSLQSNILFTASSGSAYVTHENGKLKVTICSMVLKGSNGSSSFSSNVEGSIIAP